MQDEHQVWTTAQRERWQCIREFAIGGEAAATFSARLAREQGWSAAQAAAAIEEYRRFCLLAMGSSEDATPSEGVDAVWHLHLLYTRDYWQRFCPEALGGELHHGPTAGAHELPRFREAYARTLQHYDALFGPPPEAWWPATHVRFERKAVLRQFDPGSHWLLARPRLPRALLRARSALVAAIAALLPGVAAAAGGLNPLDWEGGDFLRLFGILMVFALVASLGMRSFLKRQLTPPSRGAGELSVWETAWLAGGAERVVDAGLAELHRMGRIEVAANGSLAVSGSRREMSEPLDPVLGTLRDSVGAGGPVERTVREASKRLQSVQLGLQRRGLWFDASAAARIAQASALPWLALVLFGSAKIGVGLARDKPVAFLVIGTIVCAAFALGMYFSRPGRSSSGDAELARLNKRHATLRRAPRTEQMALAVALAGTAVLSGTALAAYHQARHPPGGSDTTSSSTDSSSGGDSSGDSGSSGCGGCGGGGGGD
jgi:uncharacterized protein (TIGR04222 family)